MSFVLKNYRVSVTGWGEATFYARNKNQARMRAFDAMQRATGGMDFKRFLQVVGPISEVPAPSGAGRMIEVLGEPAYLVEHAGGNSVSFVRPNSDTILFSHEADVRELEPQSIRL
ncbi:MAG: hypothetical protein ABNH26_08530 [Celeribacter sp.]